MTLRRQFLRHVGQTSPSPLLIEVERAQGVFFYTPQGKRYFDLVSGVSVSNVGHGNPRVVEAVQRQAADYMHVMVYGEMVERPQVRLAALVADLAAGVAGVPACDCSPATLGIPFSPTSAGCGGRTFGSALLLRASAIRASSMALGLASFRPGLTACASQPSEASSPTVARLSAEGWRGSAKGGNTALAVPSSAPAAPPPLPQTTQAGDKADARPPLDSLYFVNSGAEAVEVALKLAKRHTGRTELISCLNAYHGSTHGTLSVQGSEAYRSAFRPLLPDTRQIRFNDFDDLNLITERTACFLVEPVQGEAGIRPPAPGYLEAARRRCDEVGAMLVFDEVQTGFGRCGAVFAFQKYGVVPDAVCLGKAFGGGMPLGGVLAPKSVTDDFTRDPVLGHITTFGGHPVCCAAGLAALEYIIENDLCTNAERMGALFEQELSGHPAVAETRRSGLLMAVELGSGERLHRVMELFAREGILSDWFLFCDTAFRISPPLTISESEVRECCAVIRGTLESL